MVRVNGAFELEFQSRPRAEDLHFIFESSFQSTGSQMDGLLLEQKTANFRRSFVGGFCDCFEFPLKLLGLAYQFVKAELGTQLNSGQQLEYAVVQLPGDAPALFLNRCRRSCVLESCSAIPSGFQVYPLGPQDHSVDYSDRSLCLSAPPKTHDMGKTPHLERLFPAHREGAGFNKGPSLSKRLLDKQAFHSRRLFQKPLLDLITSQSRHRSFLRFSQDIGIGIFTERRFLPFMPLDLLRCQMLR